MPTTSDSVWDDSLIHKYNLAGPRYTSYPTAPQFKQDFALGQLRQAITAGNDLAGPLSLYFHIPFCDTICYYCGCNKIVTANKQRAIPYLARLHKEIEMKSSYYDPDRTVDQLHWGGGTPTYISQQQMSELMTKTAQHFNLQTDDSGEYSIEIHPQGIDRSTISHLRQLGFNRLSMGVQDFHPDTQKAVNRFNSESEVRELVEQSKIEGFHSLSMDLIYGLPHQTVETFTTTLDKIIDMSPSRLSLFSYAHLPHLFKTQKQIDELALPEPEEKLAILHRSIEHLEKAGYVYIGMDHFAKPDDSLALAQRSGNLQRNFQGYSTHNSCDLVGFGVSAISSVHNVYVQNHKDIEEYNQAIDAAVEPLRCGVELNADDLIRQAVIYQLICHFELDFRQIELQFDIIFEQYFAEELMDLKPLIEDGLVSQKDRTLLVMPQGRLLIRRVCMVFDAYLKQKNQIRFSQVI